MKVQNSQMLTPKTISALRKSTLNSKALDFFTIYEPQPHKKPQLRGPKTKTKQKK